MPTNTWYDTSGTLSWNNTAGWSLGRVPINGDAVHITGPKSPNSEAPAAPLVLQSLNTTGLTDPNGFDSDGNVGPQLSIASGGYLLLANTTGPDQWNGDATLAATATFAGSSINQGTIADSATFKNSSSNSGTVGNLAIFQDASTNSPSGEVGNQATFLDTSQNSGHVGDNAIFRNSSVAAGGTYGNISTSITQILDAASWFLAQVNAGTVYWASTGKICGGSWAFSASLSRSRSSHTVGGGILAGL